MRANQVHCVFASVSIAADDEMTTMATERKAINSFLSSLPTTTSNVSALTCAKVNSDAVAVAVVVVVGDAH